MKLTIVHDSDSNASVHRAGCADITRRAEKKRSHLSSYDTEAGTQQEAANDAWSDFIGESMDEEDALGYTTFLPCCSELPAR
jgi:hypothetical protein